MKVFDCFLFFNELELLELRLMTLDDFVDYFVLVESNRTFVYRLKEFIFENNKERYSRWLDKIIHIKVGDTPCNSNPWDNEFFQRNCIVRGLDRAEAGDKIIISDLDEIPNPDLICQSFEDPYIILQQKLFYYYVNCLQNQLWCGPIITLFPLQQTPQFYRSTRELRPDLTIPDGGWHYSYMGGAVKVLEKVTNLSHWPEIQDEGFSQNLDDIQHLIDTQQDLYKRSDDRFMQQLVDITQPGMTPNCMPQFLQKHPSFYFSGGCI